MARESDQERETPNWIYDQFDREFHFTCDAAASAANHKHPHYFTEQQDALQQIWKGSIWLNPPWNRIEPFMRTARGAAQAGATVVCLVPLWTTERWFKEHAIHGEIRLLSDLVAFVGFDGKSPQALCIVVFTAESQLRPDGSLYVKVETIRAPGKQRQS